jgi:hypothetical protein
MKAPIEWLLEGEPYIVYRARRDLLGQAEQEPEVAAARKAMLASPALQSLVAGLCEWPGIVISSHKSAAQPFHRLSFLAELGLTARDPGMETIIARILEHQSEEGPFQLPSNVPVRYGGTGEDTWAWALCDAPLVVYSLAVLGLAEEPQVRRAAAHLVGLVRENGWPCALSKEMGKWRGPGRKEDPCPYANLAMLKAMSVMEEYRDSPAAQAGAETLLKLWHASLEQHPYIFYMGTDFRKLKVPLVWYDLVHVLDVLTRFPWLRSDARLSNMLGVLTGKMDAQGCFTLESVWAAWKEWEFGQKKVPSRWLTLSAWRIIRRMDGGGLP